MFGDALNKCSPLVSPPTRHMRNALKLTGTGSSRGPRLRGMGAQMFNSDVPVRVEHFYPVPVCFGVIRELMQHPLGGCGVPKREIGCTSLTWEYCSPSFPSGFPPPLGKSTVLLKCGIYFSSFLIEFESRIEIIERRTVLTEHRSRGEEGDSTRTAPVST